jgi:2-methylisocitrate lyase-like PEP mutase family enzyme
MPNPWDVGSARTLVALGFSALATTSSGFAASLGRLDGSVTRDEALAHAGRIMASVDVPVSADLENGFAEEPAPVADTVAAAAEVGLAGCSIEDYGGEGIYDLGLAVDRIAAAAEAAAGRLVLTARAENYLHGRRDLADTITRLQHYQAAGADVLYAPGLFEVADIKAVVQALDRPVNVLLLRGGPTVGELAACGVSRVSIGGTFAFTALGALAEAGREVQGEGSYSFWGLAAKGRDVASAAFDASRRTDQR